VLGKKVSFSLMVLSLFLFSCNNYTKEEYLRNYEYFIVDIKRDWKIYSDEEWEKLSIKNNNFHVNYYKKFASELSTAERIRVNRFNFVFHFYKGDITLKSLLSGDYNDVFKGSALELNEIIRELKLALNDFESERTTVIINKLLE
jgi:hypothetical protein